MEENVGLRYPLSVQIEVTEDCNHKCFYCYNYWREDKFTNNKMSFESTKNLMNILFEQVKPFDTVITGGEPLMNMPASLEIAKQLFKKNAPCSMNTNLSLLNKNKLLQLKNVNQDMGFLVSLPYFQNEKFKQITGANTLNKVLQNLENMIKEGFDPTINMVVHKLNKNSVYEQGKFLVENYGIKKIAVTPALKPAFRENSNYHLDNDEMISTLRDLVKLKNDFNIKISALEVIPYCALPKDLRKDKTFRRGCSAGRSSVQIAYNGDIRACGHSPFTEGNIFTESFENIWNRLNVFRKNEYVPNECKECVEIKSCLGGCRYEGLKEGEGLNKKDSRMVGKLEKTVAVDVSFSIDKNIDYKVNLYGTRKENENEYLLYNGGTLLVNESMKKFIEGIKSKGFKLNNFPEQYREKAEKLGRVLKAGGFLVE